MQDPLSRQNTSNYSHGSNAGHRTLIRWHDNGTAQYSVSDNSQSNLQQDCSSDILGMFIMVLNGKTLTALLCSVTECTQVGSKDQECPTE